MKRMYGWTCDICNRFFSWKAITAEGKKRELHFCSLKCKGKYLKVLS